jgi:hypothetical protein
MRGNGRDGNLRPPLLCSEARPHKSTRGSALSTTVRQVLTRFSEFFIFREEISRQDGLGTTIPNSVDPQHPRFCHIGLLPEAAILELEPAY